MKELMVESVKADNLKEIVVTFNHEVDKEKLSANLFSLSPSAGKLTVEASEDGKMVTLTTENALNNQKAYKLTAANVVSKENAEVKLAKTVTEFTAFDATLPEVLSMEFTGPRAITFTFSEPVKKGDKLNLVVKTGNTTMSVNKNKVDDGRKVTVPFFTNFVSGKEYTIDVQGFVDYAGYANINKQFVTTYEKDTTAPVATVTGAEQEYIVVEFSKPVTGVSNDNFAHTFSGYKARKVTLEADYTKAAVNSTDAVQKVYVWFYGQPDPQKDNRALAAGENKVMIFSKNTTQIADLWGNKLADTTEVVKVTADPVMPEVVEVKVKEATATSTTLEVVFNKNVKFEKKHIEVLNKEGKTIAGLLISAPTGSGKKYDVKLNKDFQGKDIIVNIKGVLDTSIAQNKIADFSQAISVTDKTAPAITKVTYSPATDADKTNGLLYVFFNDDVDASALEVANYQYVNAGIYTKLTGNAEMFNGNMIVKISLNKKEDAAITATTTQLFVDNVKDIAGNVIKATLHPIGAHSTAAVPTIEKAELTAADRVKLVFNMRLTEVKESEFFYGANSLNDSQLLPALQIKSIVEQGEADGVTYLIVEINKEANIEDPITNKTVYIKATGVTGEFGVANSATISKADVVDKIRPEVAKNLDGTYKVTRVDDKFTIEFTRNVKTESAAQTMSDLVVTHSGKVLDPLAGDYAVSDIHTAGQTTLTITIGSLKDGEYTIATKDAVSYIQTAKNKLVALPSQSFDVIAPVQAYIRATTDPSENDADSLVITFKEELYKDGVPLTDREDVKSSFTPNGGVSITSAIYSKANKTITFAFAGAVDTNTIAFKADKTEGLTGANLQTQSTVIKYHSTGTVWKAE
ncbi:MAG: Ig-like domain-containing protein [Bacillota bacterium]|nr:Ig-like domain-containing protein [Bacillota bacterium]